MATLGRTASPAAAGPAAYASSQAVETPGANEACNPAPRTFLGAKAARISCPASYAEEAAAYADAVASLPVHALIEKVLLHTGISHAMALVAITAEEGTPAARPATAVATPAAGSGIITVARQTSP